MPYSDLNKVRNNLLFSPLFIISLLGNAFPFLDLKVRVTCFRFRFNNE